MRPSLRTTLLALALFVGGAIAGPVLASSGGASDAPSIGAVPERVPSGPTSVFVPITTYRNLDTRLDSLDKVRATDKDLFGTNPLTPFVQFDRTDPLELAIPDEAVAVSFNVTVTATEGAGFVQVDTTLGEFGSTSTVNWSGPGQTVANSGVAQLGPAFDDQGAVALYLDGSPDAAAHIVLDITGYYVPAT